MIKAFKEYFHHADLLPPKEKAIEKTRMLLEVILVITFVLEFAGVVSPAILNYILAPGLFMYACLFAMKSFKEATLLSIMMIIIAGFVAFMFFKGL